MSNTITGPRTGTLSAWHRPGAADEVWYPIAAMRWAGVPVVVLLERGGTQVLAIVRRNPCTKKYWWVQIGVGEAGGWRRCEETQLDAYGRVPPSRNGPTAFRPLDARELVGLPRALAQLAVWRHPLPPRLDPVFGRNRPPERAPEPAEGVDPRQGSDDWPYPGLALGLGPPASIEECEARILRAFRTSNAQAGVGHGGRETCADIPREMVLTALKFAEQERIAQEGARAQSLDAVRSGWTPTKRDLADWWVALGWLEGLASRKVRIVALRAADPPWSFNQIKDHVRVACGKTAKAHYGQAMRWAFAVATGNGQRAASGGEGS